MTLSGFLLLSNTKLFFLLLHNEIGKGNKPQLFIINTSFLLFSLLHEIKTLIVAEQGVIWAPLQGHLAQVMLAWLLSFLEWNISTYLGLEVCRNTCFFCSPPLFCSHFNMA